MNPVGTAAEEELVADDVIFELDEELLVLEKLLEVEN